MESADHNISAAAPGEPVIAHTGSDKLLENVATPLSYKLAKEIDTLCEISCAAETVQDMNTDTRLCYSETVIGVVKYQSKLNTALATNFYGGKGRVSWDGGKMGYWLG